MSNWIQIDKDWFNLDDFCHIRIETRSFQEEFNYILNHTPRIIITGYYLMGQWRHSGEEVIMSQDWKSIDELKKFISDKLDLKGWIRQ